ncbi:MAG: hypothetical protein P8Z36_14795 [Gemmatimonadota bacterium]|jgi:hypothetical protein
MSIKYERQNERVLVAKQDGEEVARIVTTPSGKVSYRIEDGSHKGGPAKDEEHAKKAVEKYFA